MEVLPHSGVQYVGELDAKQTSGTEFVNNGESNCVQHENKVQMTNGKMDGMLLNVEEPVSERRGEGQRTGEELPISEGHLGGVSYFDCQLEGQGMSCGSHDFEYDDMNAQNECTGPCQASENSNLIVDTIESEVPSDNKEGESSFSEPKWLEHDESVALWVKVSCSCFHPSLISKMLFVSLFV